MEPTEGRVVVFLDRSGVEGQPSKAGAAAVQVKGVGQETERNVEVVRGVQWRGANGGGCSWEARGGRERAVDGG